MLSFDRLRDLLTYVPESGIFLWRKKISKKVIVGREAGTIVNGYVEIRIDLVRYGAHRLAWLYMTGKWPSEIDHINRNRGDNRWENLREVPHHINCQNRGVPVLSSSGVQGVYRENSKWKAQIKYKGKTTRLGVYETKEEAEAIYRERKELLWKSK